MKSRSLDFTWGLYVTAIYELLRAGQLCPSGRLFYPEAIEAHGAEVEDARSSAHPAGQLVAARV